MSSNQDNVELIATALVREYLSTKKFVETLKILDVECPRSDQSISSRQELARSLGVHRPPRGQGAILDAVVRRLLKKVIIFSHSEDLTEHSNTCSTANSFPPSCYDVNTHVTAQLENNVLSLEEGKNISQNFISSSVETHDLQKTPLLINEVVLMVKPVVESPSFDSISSSIVTTSQYITNPNSSPSRQISPLLYPVSEDNTIRLINLEKDKRNLSSEENAFNKYENDICDQTCQSEQISNYSTNRSLKESVPFTGDTKKQAKEPIADNILTKNYVLIKKVKEIQSSVTKNERAKNIDNSVEPAVKLDKVLYPLKNINNRMQQCEKEDINLKILEPTEQNVQNNLLLMTKGEGDVEVIPPLRASSAPDGATPLALPAALELKTLILGDSEAQFPCAWREEGIEFSGKPKLGYGLQLNKDGPCGALAALQGFVLKALLFCSPSGEASTALDPGPERARAALVAGISDVLWQCGQRCSACLAIPTFDGGPLLAGNGRYRRDGVTEALLLLHLENVDAVREAVARYLPLLQAPGGCALFLCSAVLSRGLAQTAADMGDACAPLLVRGGECAPELVSLVLTGRASMRDEKHGDERLSNIPARADIGLLTLAEHYGHCRVGSFLKTPRYPIWLVLAQGRYSVLFSTRRQLVSDWRAELAFRLHLYKGSTQRRPLQLAVVTGGAEHAEDERPLSPVELVIRTKWTGAMVQWIDTDT